MVSNVRKYVGVPTAMSEEEHNLLHRARPGSSSEHPHSFAFHPILRDNEDVSSDVVGVIAMATSWDEALLDLLPEGVTGLLAVIKNSCNQTYTYEIEGGDAFFQGEGDLHDKNLYDEMEVVVNLALNSHDEFASTPGHCQYSMVRNL